MKLLEITIKPDRVTIRREAEDRLTGEQKQTIILSVIACVALLGVYCPADWRIQVRKVPDVGITASGILYPLLIASAILAYARCLRLLITSGVVLCSAAASA